MRIDEYQKLAMRTSADGHDRILNGCMGLIGEAGEVVDAVKKWKFQSGDHADLPKDKLIDECGDVLWYCAELATGLADDMNGLYETLYDNFYNHIHVLSTLLPIEKSASFLAAVAVRPFLKMYDAAENIPFEYKAAQAKSELVGIMCFVGEILERHCDSNLAECMERNIEKLRKRYPDGFDPERSIHRES